MDVVALLVIYVMYIGCSWLAHAKDVNSIAPTPLTPQFRPPPTHPYQRKINPPTYKIFPTPSLMVGGGGAPCYLMVNHSAVEQDQQIVQLYGQRN